MVWNFNDDKGWKELGKLTENVLNRTQKCKPPRAISAPRLFEVP